MPWTGNGSARAGDGHACRNRHAACWHDGQPHSPAARPRRWEAVAPCTRAARRCWSPWRPPSRWSCPGGTLCARHTASRSVSNSELKRPRACSRGTSWHSLPPGSLARWQAACPPSFCLIRRVRPAAGRPAASCCACATCCLVACLTGAHGVSPRLARVAGAVLAKLS